jgi:hypothetical protein
LDHADSVVDAQVWRHFPTQQPDHFHPFHPSFAAAGFVVAVVAVAVVAAAVGIDSMFN